MCERDRGHCLKLIIVENMPHHVSPHSFTHDHDPGLCELLSIQRWVNLEIAKAASINSAPSDPVASSMQSGPRIVHAVHRKTSTASDAGATTWLPIEVDSKYIARRVL